jgi:ubiquinone/menaquinone biosynthesis C-methylase UbiE
MSLSTTEAWDALFSDFYLRAFADEARDAEAQEQALAAARLSGCPDDGDLVDVACGFGRHAVPLARAGYRVVAVDRSQALLDEARRRGGGERWPKLVRADYRELPLPDESFDAALNLFSSLGYLGDEDDTKVLGEIRRVLRPGGRLVIEIMQRDALVLRFRDTGWHMVGEGRLLLEQRTFDPVAGVAQETQTLIEPSGERESRTFSLRVYTATELLAMLDRAGFEESRCYGDLSGGRFAGDSRLVILARR